MSAAPAASPCSPLAFQLCCVLLVEAPQQGQRAALVHRPRRQYLQPAVPPNELKTALLHDLCLHKACPLARSSTCKGSSQPRALPAGLHGHSPAHHAQALTIRTHTCAHSNTHALSRTHLQPRGLVHRHHVRVPPQHIQEGGCRRLGPARPAELQDGAGPARQGRTKRKTSYAQP